MTTMGALDQLEPIEKASKDALVALQLDRLKATLHQAYDKVPHYKKKLDAAGVHPSDLKELADLAKFPFTTKEDLRQNYPFGMFAVPMADIVRIHASSGTTGKPTVVGYTKTDIDTWSLLMARSIRAAGGRSADKIHVAYGYGLFTGGLGAHYGGEALGAAVIPVGGGFTERQVQLIRDFAPDIIMVTPSYMLAIADEFERQGFSPADCSLRLGIFGAEPWTETMRAEIERRMGIVALDLYGLSEVMGPGVAQECAETRDGLTVWEDHFFPEIIDPDTGRVLPDGEVGELVFTSLTKEAMPVIRYRTRDLTRLLARHGAHHAPHRTRQGPQRRHADHPRRQRLSLADRSGARPRAAAGAALRPGGAPAAQSRRARCAGRDAARACRQIGRRRKYGAGEASRAPDQGLCRRHRHGARAGAGHDRALARQSKTRHRPAGEKLKCRTE